MVQDSRQRTKTFLDTYLTAGNMLRDDEVIQLSFITQYGDPTYPFKRVMYAPKNNDLVFCVFTAESEAVVDWDGSVYGYVERVPIKIYSVTKQGITGPEARWKAEAELRRIVENNPLIDPLLSGDYRSIQRMSDNEVDMGGWMLFSVTYILTYERDLT